MQAFPPSLIATARRQFGLLTVDDFQIAGVSQHVRSAAISAGVLAPVHRTVFVLTSHEQTFEQRCAAACLAVPDAALSGPTAGRLLGLRRVTTNDVHVVANRMIKLNDVVAHRTNFWRPLDIDRRGPLRILKPARLACDLASFLDDEGLESVIEQLIDRRWVQIDAMRDLARQFMASGRNGTARLGRVLDHRPNWRRPVGSDLELRLLRVLEQRGLSLSNQVRVTLDTGRDVLIDLADPVIKFGIEVDHVTWHGGRLDAQRDKVRDRMLTRQGWTIVRVTDDDIERRFAATVDQLVEIADIARARASA